MFVCLSRVVGGCVGFEAIVDLDLERFFSLGGGALVDSQTLFLLGSGFWVAVGGCVFFWVSLSCSRERAVRKKRCRVENKSCSGHGVGEQALLLRGGLVARRRGELHVW